jgi:hypothetical protein
MPWYSKISVYLIFFSKFCMHTSHKTWIVVHYRVIDNPSLFPIMIEKNPVHSLQPYFFNNNFSNIFPSTFRCLKKFWFFGSVRCLVIYSMKLSLRLGAHWELFVAQLFSCPDGEHCCIRERARWQLFCCGNRKVAAWCGLTHSRGNWNVADKDRKHVFQSVRARWQLNSCLLAAVRCTNRVSRVIHLCLS